MAEGTEDRLAGDILFVTRKWSPAMGGMETYCVKLTEQLAQRQDVEVIALPGRDDGFPPRISSLAQFPFTVFRRYLKRKEPPTVLHLGDMAIWPLGFLSWLRRTQVVLSAHGTDVSYPRRRGVKGRLYGAYLQLGARLLPKARVIANSRATEEAVRENGWRNVVIVPLATDMRSDEPGRPNGTEVLFVGRLIKRKGCAWFVREVLPALPEPMVLQVAGTAWDPKENAALESPRVEFLGNLTPERLGLAYSRALCVVVPNIPMQNGEFEGFGLVAAEAAAAGGVVLAANHGGLREAVLDGETGFLVPAGDPVAWQCKIVEIASWSPEQRRGFVEGAIRRAKEYYSWRRVAADTLAAYPGSDATMK